MTDARTLDGAGLHILVAEDNAVNQRVVEKLLKRLGCTCQVVNNGRQVVTLLKEGHYDLVLMDIMMPELDGMEATRQIRALNNASAHIPIVAFTANGMRTDQDACLAAGMNDFISKPVTIEQMSALLSRWAAKISGQDKN